VPHGAPSEILLCGCHQNPVEIGVNREQAPFVEIDDELSHALELHKLFDDADCENRREKLTP
jgi:hypothetical protein